MLTYRVALLYAILAASAFGSSVGSLSKVSLLSGDYYGSLSVSHADIRVDSGGGINYGGQAASSGVFGNFSLFALANGSASGYYAGVAFAGAQAQVFYSDSLTFPGTGHGTFRIPFLVEGAVNVSTSANALFGFTFCQTIPTGSPTGGVGCAVTGLPPIFNTQPPNVYFNSPTVTAFSQLFNLDFPVTFGIPEDLNFTVTLSAQAGHPIASSKADFSHTGTAQPAQLFDQFGTLIPNPTITSASGFNYLNPQFATVPEPCSLILAAAGLLLLGLRTRSIRR
jgi:hypothetical protein